MKIFMFAFLLGFVGGKPQYNYPRPSGGQVSPGGKDTPHQPAYYNPPSELPFPGNNEGNQFQLQSGQENYGAQQTPIVNKHVYVHIPPPELEEELAASPSVSSGRPVKNYKIIFIKAPTNILPQSAYYSAQTPKEEKTLIYVLVKKPEDAAQVSFPTAEPTKASKPEVFFVRYKPIKEFAAGGQKGMEQNVGQTIPGTEQTGSSGYQIGQNEGPGARYLPIEQRSSTMGKFY